MGRRLKRCAGAGSTRAIVFVAASVPAFALLAASLVHPVLEEGPAAELGLFLGRTCHRLPERCLDLPWGTSGLCARCTAFWAGLGLSVVLLGASGHVIGNPLQGLLLVLPMAADGFMQYLGLYESLNTIRLSTGFAGGCGTGLMLVWLASAVFRRARVACAGR